jgi:hypothetical protein
MPKDNKKKKIDMNSSIINQDSTEFRTLKQLIKYFFPGLYEVTYGRNRGVGHIRFMRSRFMQ